MNIALIIDVLPLLFDAACLTIQITAAAIMLGFCLAVPLALARADGPTWLSRLVFGYTFFFRGTPLLVQLFLIYYGLGQLPWIRSSFAWPLLRDPYWCALLAFSLNHAAYTTEILRGAIRALPQGALEAAKAVGMSYLLRTRRISFPIAFRSALPSYTNEIVLMLKASSLASTVTLMELTGTSRKIISETFAPYEVFLAAASVYLLITFFLVRLSALLERRLCPPTMRGGKGEDRLVIGALRALKDTGS
ncbi:ABC transporter permease [Agrobacterium salinitolerans]|uniref:ABC transporter permease n=1 Tax=Agrobacterium salinitolerans TaxID=1183413 RepID=UPI00157321E5|nr:ABC transporter permease [Agrobacterium salinitolerans]NTA40379.1 ABC transporter permease [Agrobacterium salinitolerans]